MSETVVLSAHDMMMGDVIYLDANGKWVRSLREAYLFVDRTEAETALADAQTQSSLIGPSLDSAKMGANGPEPLHFRDRFRSEGPSNYFHGKQEHRPHVSV